MPRRYKKNQHQETYHLSVANAKTVEWIFARIDQPILLPKPRVVDLALTLGLRKLIDDNGLNISIKPKPSEPDQEGNQEPEEEVLSQTVQKSKTHGK